ncbi:MAG: phage terminase large subunit [Rudaea sp.]|nr:phage terminase large subunit [Rudaea sp.]
MNLTWRELNLLLYVDFYTFVQRAFAQLNPTAPFVPSAHLEVLCAKLDAVRQGKIKRLIVNVPPRSLKSVCASIALPAFWLGQDPSAQILTVSYAAELALKLAGDCRSVMAADWYKNVFTTRLSAQKNAVNEFMTTQQGVRLSTSVGGVLTGRGADVIIIDDPLKPEEALSETQRRHVNEWFDHTLYSRLNSKVDSAIIIIMQRLHEDDLVGHVLGQEPWEVLSFPAIAEQDESIVFETPAGMKRFSRRAGEVLQPDREPQAVLDSLRQSMGEYHFSGQYGQRPMPLGGGMIKEKWFARYDTLPEKFDGVLQSWDTANKATELSDYSACTTWGLKGKDAYLLHVLRKRMNYPELKRAVIAQWQLHRPTTILIEDKGSGIQLIQELQQENIAAVKRYVPETDKIVRMHAQTAMIENSRVLLPRQAPWLADYLNELMRFPRGKYDDQVDSTSQALAWIQVGQQEPHILVYYRMLAGQKRGKKGPDSDEDRTLIIPG